MLISELSVPKECFSALLAKIGKHIVRPQGYTVPLTYNIARLLDSSVLSYLEAHYEQGVVLYHLAYGQYHLSVADHGFAHSTAAVRALFIAATGAREMNFAILTSQSVEAAMELERTTQPKRDGIVAQVAEKPLPKASLL